MPASNSHILRREPARIFCSRHASVVTVMVTISGVARILLQGGPDRVAHGFQSSWRQSHPEVNKLYDCATYWNLESDAIPIFLSQNISGINISVVPIFP